MNIVDQQLPDLYIGAQEGRATVFETNRKGKPKTLTRVGSIKIKFMKKSLLGIFAIIAAVSLSAYSTHHVSKSNTLTTYWFYVSDGDPAGTSSSPSVSPLQSCSTTGAGCIDGFESATPLSERPQEDPDGQFKQ